MNSQRVALMLVRMLMLSFSFTMVATVKGETPIQAWVKSYNGTGNNTDNSRAVAVDRNNNIIVTGHSVGSTSGFDYATVKYSSQGVPLWTNRLNGAANGSETAAGLVVDSNNDIIVTGYSALVTNNEYLTIKYSSAGAPLWTNHYSHPSGADARATAAALDANNNIFITGKASNDYVTIQISSAGVPLWTNTYNGGPNTLDTPSAIAVDASNNVVVTGESQGNGAAVDFVTIKYSNAGVPLCTNRFDGPSSSIDEPAAMVIDSGNNILITGRAVSGYYSFATIKYSSSGTPLWTNYFREVTGTTAYPNAIAIDRDDKVFVTGYYFAGLYENYATVAYSSSGIPLWTNYYNGPSNNSDIARSVKTDDNGNVFVTGYSGGDFATIKYSNVGVPIWTNIYNGPGNGGDEGWALAVDNNGDVILTGQSYGTGSGFDYTTIKFSSPPVMATGQITNGVYQVKMRRPNTVIIEASTNLPSWTPIYTNNTSTNLLIYTDPSSAGSVRRFYRAVRTL